MEQQYLNILEAKLKPALGCTEPIAIALAGAIAAANSKGDWITRIRVSASGNILKNAMAVTIPGTTDAGVQLAVTLGVLSKNNAEKQLEVLAEVDQGMIDEAKRLIALGWVHVEVADTDKKLYIEVELHTRDDVVRTIIEDQHTNLTLIEVDGKALYQKGESESGDAAKEGDTSFMTLDGIVDFVETVPLERLGLIRESIRMNRAICEEGLKNPYGLEVGRTAKRNMENGLLGGGIANSAIAITAAGSDARMAGASMAVMSNSGSGNQGITATMPVVAVGEKLGLPEERIIRAAAMSNLVSIYIKARFGVLSALCGATVAATGASMGITYLLDGDRQALKRSIKNMIGNLAGIICDGAKPGCAFKVANCAGSAVNAALLAIDGHEICGNEGIVAATAEETIENFCRISRDCSTELDEAILDIMVSK